jgi:hypothetical protein
MTHWNHSQQEVEKQTMFIAVIRNAIMSDWFPNDAMVNTASSVLETAINTANDRMMMIGNKAKAKTFAVIVAGLNRSNLCGLRRGCEIRFPKSLKSVVLTLPCISLTLPFILFRVFEGGGILHHDN